MVDLISHEELMEGVEPEVLESMNRKFELLKREEIHLAELRHALRLSQATIAKNLNVNQSSVAKLEKRTDMLMSTLRSFVEAMGGELDLVARFPGHEYRIKSFSDLHEEVENDCHA